MKYQQPNMTKGWGPLFSGACVVLLLAVGLFGCGERDIVSKICRNPLEFHNQQIEIERPFDRTSKICDQVWCKCCPNCGITPLYRCPTSDSGGLISIWARRPENASYPRLNILNAEANFFGCASNACVKQQCTPISPEKIRGVRGRFQAFHDTIIHLIHVKEYW